MRLAFLAILPLLSACEGEVEKAVRRDMLDPDAAQFRDVRRCTGDTEVWRGEVNGKNKFGAYTGFKSFFYAKYSVAYADDPDFLELMNRCYSDLEKPADDPAKEPADTSENETPSGSLPAPTSAPKSVAANSDVDFDSETEGMGRPNLAEVEQCWADYCPCDSNDPDYGYLDISICRDLRMGVAVSDEKFSIGAKSRDARRALREFNEDYP